VASSIAPIGITVQEVAPALILGLASVALTYPPPSGVIRRWRGLILLGVYAAYLVAMLQWS
jgi:cation:H+ antiporter